MLHGAAHPFGAIYPIGAAAVPPPNANPNPNGAASAPGPPTSQAQAQAQAQAPPSPQAPPQPQLAAHGVREAAGRAAVAAEQVQLALSGGSRIRAAQLATPRAPPAAARLLEAFRRCWHRGGARRGAPA